MRINRKFDDIYLNIVNEENTVFPPDKELKQYIYSIFLANIKNNNICIKIPLIDLKDKTFNIYIQKFLERISNKIYFNCIIDTTLNTEGMFNVDAVFVKQLKLMSSIIKKEIESKLRDIRYSDQLFKNLLKNIYDDNVSLLCSITINPMYITLDDNDLTKYTLEEVVEHETQHLYTFLLNLSKEINLINVWYSNNFIGFRDGKIDQTLQYYLDEDEFITLFGTYCNLLIRILKDAIQKPTKQDILNFIKCLLNLIFDKETNSQFKYVIQSNPKFENIKQFYLTIYQDQNFIFDKNIDNILPKIKKSKWKQLLIWTYKNIVENFKVKD